MKKYFLKIAKVMERLYRENSCKAFKFISEVFDITEIYLKTDIFITILGSKSSSIERQMLFDKSQ